MAHSFLQVMRSEGFVFYIYFFLVHFVLFLFTSYNGNVGFAWFGFVGLIRLSFGWGFGFGFFYFLFLLC